MYAFCVGLPAESTSERRRTHTPTGQARGSRGLFAPPWDSHGSEPPHLVVDSAGAKFYGEGEWKVRQHCYSKRRTWHKVHLALVANTGQLRASLMTHQYVADGEVLPKLLEQIPDDEFIDTLDSAARRRGSLQSGYHRRSLTENAMYRLTTPTGPCPWACRTDTQTTEVAVRVGVLNRMAELTRLQSVRIV